MRSLPLWILLVGSQWIAAARAATLHVPAEYATLADALGASVSGDTVEVACGAYEEHNLAMPSGVVLRSASGDPDCVSIDGEEFFCLRLSDATGTTIEGIEFTGAATGIYMINESVATIQRCRFRANASHGDGGGLVVTFSSFATVLDCEFLDNNVRLPGNEELQRGGGAWSNVSGARFEDCVFAGNQARIGGAVFSMHSTLEFLRCTFVNNSSQWGAGIYETSADLTFEDCVFEGNQTDQPLGQQGRGGAAFMEGGNSVYRGCTFTANFAGHSGGAVYCQAPGTLLAENCTFRGNRAYVNGGAGILAGPSQLAWCVIVGNEAIANNGGAFILVAPTTISQCTFWRNRAGSHGSALVWTSPILTMTRSIIAGGVGGGGPVYCFDKDDAAITCTDIFGNEGGDWVACIAGDAGANGNVSADPLFCDAAADELHLQWGSPCLPANSGGCGLIGALGFGGCGTISTQVESWSRLKARYR